MNEKEIWLIKSSNQILGPFDYEKVIEMLQNRQIAVIDEIRDHRSRWMFIREHKQFQDQVQKVRDQQSNQGEETSTLAGEKTVEVLAPVITRQAPVHQSQPPPIRNQQIGNPKEEKNEVRKISPLLVAVIIVGIGYAASLIYKKERSKNLLTKPKNNFYQQFQDYSMNRETVALRKLIKESSWSESKKEMASAVSFIDEGSFEFAKEALAKLPDSWRKLYNQLVIMQLTDDRRNLDSGLKNLVDEKMPTPLLLLKMLENIEASSNDHSIFNWGPENIEESYQQKYWLLKVLALGVQGNEYQMLFSLVPDENIFFKDPELAHGYLNWNSLADLCLRKLKSGGRSEKIRAVVAFCHLKKNDFMSAEEVIRSALASNPFHSELKILESYIFIKTQRFSEAGIVLDDSRLITHPLTSKLKALSCLEQQDFGCALQKCTELNESAFKSHCLIESYEASGNSSKADELRRAALQKYPDLLAALSGNLQ